MTTTLIEDVEVDHGPLSVEDTARVLVLIERAEAQIALRVPDLAARISAGRTSTALLRQVVAELVTAKLRNPHDYVSSTRSITNGPFSSTESGTRPTGSTSGLTLTRRHMRLLGEVRGCQSIPVGDPALSSLSAQPAVAQRDRGGDSRPGTPPQARRCCGCRSVTPERIGPEPNGDHRE
ncbi:hypothetical protein Acsp06_41510 [Actinomycetospora sp. NBRC 106375]|uniref:hypothetical protein n=1 Tax=Actinomycetospora sp. NBRC 106375 TaxID=3032207 RepID=UPI0024A08802|nr:hypothetical protein [Actinomycetospora sp. NBRC 106375]GLZ47966.1 hypothetical protein Acsp06_41510 [Actinomycetospora sp. NBRC 106375]